MNDLYTQLSIVIDYLKKIIASGQYHTEIFDLLNRYLEAQQVVKRNGDLNTIQIQDGCRMYLETCSDYFNPMLDEMYKAEQMMATIKMWTSKNQKESRNNDITKNKRGKSGIDGQILNRLVFGDKVVILFFANDNLAENVICYGEEGTERWKINDIIKEEVPATIISISKTNKDELMVFSNSAIRYIIDMKTDSLVSKENLKRSV